MAIADEHRLGETPLTDPRSLGTSALFHIALAALASLSVLTALTSPADDGGRKAMRGELEPVDNRAKGQEKESGVGGGGGPGDIGGLGDPEMAARPRNAPEIKPVRDPTADALLSEILPRSDVKLDETRFRDLPELPTSGAGLIPGSGSGGGGGEGGGSGGGVGRGIGPGTEFFGSREHGRSFAYVIDCSGSMSTRNALDIAKRELLASLDRLPPDVRFSVTFYDLNARKLTDAQGRPGLMPATGANKARVRAQLAAVAPFGGTDHLMALRTALVDKPEVIFFLTDAASMTNDNVATLLSESGRSRIQAIEFGLGRDLGQNTPLRRLATTTGGAYFYVDTSKFPKSAAGY
ncbi:VWA domain-containing protein [Paludisphaera soli]|uniref:VWA domain-containing protein n=1 Tax=Paludisphaera soli TaxID=2712865 RepID=UPI0013ED08D4|nr:VWA domain-containing protein [Paludisphaera soli]